MRSPCGRCFQGGFVEGGYGFAAGAWGFEPYAQVRVETDGFEERGGVAALTGASSEQRIKLSTVGLRFNVDLKSAQQNERWLSLRVGRRHASGDLTPESSASWTGGSVFTVLRWPKTRRWQKSDWRYARAPTACWS